MSCDYQFIIMWLSFPVMLMLPKTNRWVSNQNVLYSMIVSFLLISVIPHFLFTSSLLLSFFLSFTGQLKGVMRVGTFARGMLLKGQLNIDLVLMCTGWTLILKYIMYYLLLLYTAKPTKDLLHEMYEQLPAKFAVSSD